MKVPQPFQYQGSKRALAPAILRYFPRETVPRLVEPFAGSGALSIACAAAGKADAYWLNDLNEPLVQLLEAVVDDPDLAAATYRSTWCGESDAHVAHYFSIRDRFNETADPSLLLYLLARCVKGAVRYNSRGEFNQSPDKRRFGIHPDRMAPKLSATSALLRGRSTFTSMGYQNLLAAVRDDDLVYMDPPYQGVCGKRDNRYLGGISFDEFALALRELNRRGVRYLVSYDGRLGDQQYGEALPSDLDLQLVELNAGRSSQATLLGRADVTVESLYLSPNLASTVESEAG